MIIVKLMGGLGNQMFQYAAGRSLSLRLGTRLLLDISSMAKAGITPRSFELDRFAIAADIAGPGAVEALVGKENALARFRAKVSRRLGLRWELPHVYREPHYHYDDYFGALPDNTFLVGYWHSERYFLPVADRIAAEFVCRGPLSGANLAAASAIEAVDSVSIHVRRGDYVSDPKINQYHGVCSLEYYRAAVEEISRRVASPHFFVFSDDHDWVREHLLIDHPVTFVTGNGPDAGHQDLRLMSLCRHQIIANSSFSWWGAWLNRNAGKVVIAPRAWFRDPRLDTRDLIPASWLRL